MMGKKTLREVQEELVALLSKLPGPSPKAQLKREIEEARGDPKRDVETLEMMLAAFEKQVRKIKPKRRPAKRVKR